MTGSRRRLDWLLPSWLEDYSAFDQSSDENMITVYYTIAVNLVCFAFFVIFFSVYRKHNLAIFTPKAGIMPDRTPALLENESFFGWMKQLYAIDDDVLRTKGGYDILFFIRFYRLAFKIFAFFAIYAWGVLLPINGTGVGSDENSFQIWSMTNIQEGSGRCWFHLIGIYILTGITIYFLEKEFVFYAKHRHIYLRQRHANLRTVLVEGIPHQLRSITTLATYFEMLYPNQVHAVHCGQDLQFLDRLIDERTTAVTQLERALYTQHLTSRRSTVYVGNMSQDVDAIRHYTYKLDDLNEAVAKEQEGAMQLARNADSASGATAFEVIESLLRVTQMGSIRKLMKEKSGHADKWLKWGTSKRSMSGNAVDGSTTDATYQRSSSEGSGYGSTSTDTKPLVDIEKGDDVSSSVSRFDVAEGGEQGTSDRGSRSPLWSGEAGAGGGRISGTDSDRGYVNSGKRSRSHSYGVYKISYSEWFWTMWTSPTCEDLWRTIKEGRHSEHRDLYDDELSLISPPEERKMFLSKAFVTFKTFTAATISRQVIHMQLAGHMAVTEAPDSSDMIWGNMYATRTQLFWRRLIVELLVLLLIVVWVAPVTLISFVLSEDALRSFFPFVNEWCSESEFFSSMVELVQPGALVMIMNFLPPILTALGILEGCISFSSNQFKSFDRYFTFQIINVFLVTAIAGSVIDCIKEIYLDPASTFKLLGNSLPKMGAYFTNYMFMKAFIGLGMEIMRVPALFSATLKTLFTANTTPRDKKMTPLFGGVRAMSNPGWFPFAKIYAQDIMLVVVCATFACIAPLALIPGLLYFLNASYIYKHQMLYVYEPTFETGGKWWPKVARCIVVALLFAQCTMVGMMILKETFTEIYFLAIIVAVTTFYYYRVYSIYEPLAAQLPLDMATAMDLDQKIFHDDLKGAEGYLQPGLRAGIVLPEVEFPIHKVDNEPAITRVEV